MADFMRVQREILIGTGLNKGEVVGLIQARGAYLRQLAQSVLCGSYGVSVASKLLLNY